MPDFARIDGALLHYAARPGAGRPVVFLNSLGTDLRIWDDVIARLPPETPTLRLDKRGHGLSGIAAADMRRYADDAACLMEGRGLSRALVCGVSVGGMIAQELALARPDLVAGLILSNTGARIGAADDWNARIDALETHGLPALADAVMERWFSPGFREAHPDTVEGYRAMLARTPREGYGICCAAIRDTDFRERASAIGVPVLCLAGGADLATPPQTVRDLAGRIPGAAYREVDGAGHLPCIEAPGFVAAEIAEMMARLG